MQWKGEMMAMATRFGEGLGRAFRDSTAEIRSLVRATLSHACKDLKASRQNADVGATQGALVGVIILHTWMIAVLTTKDSKDQTRPYHTYLYAHNQAPALKNAHHIRT